MAEHDARSYFLEFRKHFFELLIQALAVVARLTLQWDSCYWYPFLSSLWFSMIHSTGGHFLLIL